MKIYHIGPTINFEIGMKLILDGVTSIIEDIGVMTRIPSIYLRKKQLGDYGRKPR
jgi:hypothetical protein